MNPSNSLEHKLLGVKEKISVSKTNSVVRNRIKSIDLKKSRALNSPLNFVFAANQLIT